MTATNKSTKMTQEEADRTCAWIRRNSIMGAFVPVCHKPMYDQITETGKKLVKDSMEQVGSTIGEDKCQILKI